MFLWMGLLLDTDSQNYVRKKEVELYKNFHLCGGLTQVPHITIKSPFNTRELRLFAKYIDKLAKHIKSFEIELDGLSYFEPRVIFLDVKENQELKDLHLKILYDLRRDFGVEPDKYEGEDTKFHCTIAYRDVRPKKFLKAKEYLKKEKPYFKFKMKSIGLFCRPAHEASAILYHQADFQD